MPPKRKPNKSGKKFDQAEYLKNVRGKRKKDALENTNEFIYKEYSNRNDLAEALTATTTLPGAQQIIKNRHPELLTELQKLRRVRKRNYDKKKKAQKNNSEAGPSNAPATPSVNPSASPRPFVPPAPVPSSTSNSQRRPEPLVTTGIVGDKYYLKNVLPLILSPRR